MVEGAKDNLLSLLFGSERELVNIKFVPGLDPDLTPGELRDAAFEALNEVLADGLRDQPPSTGEKQLPYRERLASV